MSRFAPITGLLLGLPVWWCRRKTHKPKQASKIRWDPVDGIHVVARHRAGIAKKYKTLQSHVITTPLITLEVPSGFEFDGASIPVIVYPLVHLLDPWGRYERAAMGHDLLYHIQDCSRFQSDAIFREMMIEDGVPILPRLLIYYAVRLFGSASWKANTDAKVDRQRREKAYGYPGRGV